MSRGRQKEIPSFSFIEIFNTSMANFKLNVVSPERRVAVRRDIIFNNISYYMNVIKVTK